VEEKESARAQKTTANVVGHIQSAFPQRFENCGKEPTFYVEPKVPFRILLGWIADKIEFHGADVGHGKELLRHLAQDEHRRYRMKTMVEKTNTMNLNPHGAVDRDVLKEVLPLVDQATETTKNALRELAGFPKAPKRAWEDPACGSAEWPASRMRWTKQ